MQSDPLGKDAFREEGSGGGTLRWASNVQMQLKPEAHLTGSKAEQTPVTQGDTPPGDEDNPDVVKGSGTGCRITGNTGKTLGKGCSFACWHPLLPGSCGFHSPSS